MAVTININKLSLCHKGSEGIAKSTPPDVCKTPMPPGPVPIPYAITSFSKDLVKGTTTIFVDGGNMAANLGSEFSCCIGDEPGTLKGVVSGTQLKEATWMTYSPDVFLEDKAACRLTDKMFMNHMNTMCLCGEQQPPVSSQDPCDFTNSVGKDGFIENNSKIKNNRIPKLEKGAIDNSISGVVLHRTVTPTANSALASFERGIGTHFLVDKDGTIYQTASLNRKTYHVGKVKSEGLPTNANSIGIEVVGMYDPKQKKWEEVPKSQAESVACIVKGLMKKYNLKKENIYNHEDISAKTAGEGSTVRKAIECLLPKN